MSSSISPCTGVRSFSVLWIFTRNTWSSSTSVAPRAPEPEPVEEEEDGHDGDKHDDDEDDEEIQIDPQELAAMKHLYGRQRADAHADADVHGGRRR